MPIFCSIIIQLHEEYAFSNSSVSNLVYNVRVPIIVEYSLLPIVIKAARFPLSIRGFFATNKNK